VRAVIQRVARASVSVGGEPVASIGPGLVVLLGVADDDTLETSDRLAGKVAGLRIFEDEAGKMNLSTADIGGSVLCISQFTLYGDVRRGRRPSFEAAAPPDSARPLYEAFCGGVEREGLPCARGVFGAHMVVELVNDGPVTLILDSDDLDRPRRA
jgi:D-tyrosyl-tRNA(Tyr) deacylase